MKAEYEQDDYLMISGIQHFAFCRRQWALIHIEKQWSENVLTVEGKILHSHADDPFSFEKRKNTVITRAMNVSSRALGVSGICDIVEFLEDSQGVKISGRNGRYLPCPIEYKRGKPKEDEIDIVQLCAQALCLEEMLCTGIPHGFMYYGETRRRLKVAFTQELRNKVISMFKEMHEMFDRQHTPNVKPTKACASCSLKDICLPKLLKTKMSAKAYIKKALEVDLL